MDPSKARLYYMVGLIALTVLALVFIVLFVHCHSKCGKSSEPYCGRRCANNMCGSCVGMGLKTCPDRALVSRLYNEGKLTEYNGWGGPAERRWKSPLDDELDYEDCKPEWPSSNYV